MVLAAAPVAKAAAVAAAAAAGMAVGGGGVISIGAARIIAIAIPTVTEEREAMVLAKITTVAKVICHISTCNTNSSSSTTSYL